MALIKKIFVGVMLNCAMYSGSQAQVLLIPEAQGSGLILKNQAWSFLMNNLESTSRQVMINITATDLNTSQPLLDATSAVLLMPKGMKRVTYQDMAPLTFSFSAPGFAADRQLNQPLPVGNYLFCYRIIDMLSKQEILATECVQLACEPLSPPQLVVPMDASVITEQRPVLSWTPPAPLYMFTDLDYKLTITEVYEGQSAQEAVQRNIPLMSALSRTTSMPYTSSYSDLQPGKTYAWQVLAQDGQRPGGKSEVWTFKLMPDSIAQKISDASFVTLSKANTSPTTMHQGILKFEYVNSLPDSAVTVEIYPIQTSGRQRIHKMTIPVKSGQNLVEYNLNGRYKLHAGTGYEVRLTNSAKETWMLRFEPKFYF